jgi:acetoin utilization protein AcuB
MSRVGDWMTRHPVSVLPQTGALEALELMQDCAFRHLPVVDAAGRLVGVLTVDDLRSVCPIPADLQGVAPGGQERLRASPVSELMSASPVWTTEQAPLEEAAEELARRRIGCLPVLGSGGEVVGLLTSSDALQALSVLLREQRALGSQDRSEALEALVHDLRAERLHLAHQLGLPPEVDRALPIELACETLPRPRARAPEEAASQELAQQRLEALELALDRASKGLFGSCDQCGGEVSLERLRRVPGTTLCARCAGEEARRIPEA